MNREELLYQILYSHNLEKLYGTLTGRIDKILSFCLLLLGSAVVASIGHPVATGLFIAGITALRMAFRFEAASEHARRQSGAWLKLFNTQHQTLSDDDLLCAVTSLQEADSAVWSVLIRPAMILTQSEQGKTQREKLTPAERLFAFFSGGSVR
ncbi:hypothetical protein DU258_21115 [Salmonella enterica subsp. enterica]|nr:hypothetical protein [Salmonella enterica subsp. enterica serovar Kambole]ECG3342220.1 hypothetical protein [Salmonella enterica subsp. enterica serovar Kambole]ECO3184081.1 hypothetical protein [Salmonella enterica subsp. enterica serovar Kambole]ECY5576844.1 hypothetical protein [Salmonella enterica subsp. enterica serovar Kambole]EDN3629728.1 hypothetical protein [Salmonella enterica subsp. enterica serovar Kambole]